MNVIFALILSLMANAGTTESCFEFSLSVNGSYCVTWTEGSRNSDLVYFLHGRTKDEKAWSEMKWAKTVRDLWGSNAPRVITVSFGSNWLLVEKNEKERSGLFEVFTNEVLPHIESKLNLHVQKRLLLGESMGGFNGAQLFLKRPELFEKVALLCPAISSVSPFAGFKKSLDYVRRTGATLWKVLIAHMVVRRFIPDDSRWKDHDPLLIAQDLNASYPELYISCGRQDSYGFYEGSVGFANTARDKGVTTRWVPLDGGHCVVDPISLSDFLLNNRS